jgi:hypothetical protein
MTDQFWDRINEAARNRIGRTLVNHGARRVAFQHARVTVPTNLTPRNHYPRGRLCATSQVSAALAAMRDPVRRPARSMSQRIVAQVDSYDLGLPEPDRQDDTSASQSGSA